MGMGIVAFEAEVFEAEPQHNGAPDAVRRAHPPGDPVDQREQVRVRDGRRPRDVTARPLRADRAAPPRPW